MSWAILVGSGLLTAAADFEPVVVSASAYGAPSAVVRRGRIGAVEVLVLRRHGEAAQAVAPHRINYRANVDVLARLGVERVIALNTVGGISSDAHAGRLVVPHQVIDYSWGRAHTFSDEAALIHAEFSHPFDEHLRKALLAAGRRCELDVGPQGVYGCTQGPRLETAAEIDRMERDGCTLVGMTGMPEASLARERGLRYAMLSLVVNPAAGRAAGTIDLAGIEAVSRSGMIDVERLLGAFFERGEGADEPVG